MNFQVKIYYYLSFTVKIQYYLSLSDKIYYYLSFSVETKIYKSLEELLYGCESWTLTAGTDRRVVRTTICPYACHQEPLLFVVKRPKQVFVRHVTRHDNLSKIIPYGTVEGGRRRGGGGQRKYWNVNIKNEIGCRISALRRVAEDRQRGVL